MHSLKLPKISEIGALNWVSSRICAPYQIMLKLIMLVIGITIFYIQNLIHFDIKNARKWPVSRKKVPKYVYFYVHLNWTDAHSAWSIHLKRQNGVNKCVRGFFAEGHFAVKKKMLVSVRLGHIRLCFFSSRRTVLRRKVPRQNILEPSMSYLHTHLSGLSARSSLNTLNIPNILGDTCAITLMSTSTTEMMTRMPSIMFQPQLK